MRKLGKTAILLIAGILAITGCSSRKVVEPEIVYESQALQPGVVHNVWEEPMVDVIDIPPGLDPDGVYYRPGHQQVVEIRQGRWQYNKEAAAVNK